ncbi:MAG: thioredoxin family protein, partial [Phycisphaerae bacterium]|nr:thioredoxin family protein [Phycisphaerae bacterium]
MSRFFPIAAVLLVLAVFTAPARPQEALEPVVRSSTAWSQTAARPGEQIVLAVVLDIDPEFHIQVHRPELDWLVATDVKVQDLPTGVLYGDIQFPKPHPLKVNFSGEEQMLDFYTGRAVIFLKFSVGAQVAPGDYTLSAAATWQACDDKSCLQPETKVLRPVLKVVAAGADVTKTDTELFAAYSGQGEAERLRIPFFGQDFDIDPNNLALLLLLAAVGGFLLNLTPCVLPMIPIKIMGLSQAAQNRSRCLRLGLTMCAGVIAFWLAIGGAIAFVAGFDSINTLFQKPVFTMVVGVIILLMALGMCGLFAVRLPQWVYRINPRHDSYHGSFGFGIMTAVLSTPCTAPFMGAAAAWAATQDPAITLSTFTAIGVGMALPYAVLAAFPALVDRMPRTGPASELIKQVMGLLMMAAALFFLGTGLSGVLSKPPDPPSAAYWWAVGLAVAVAGGWLAYSTMKITRSPARRAIFGAIGLALVVGGLYGGLRLSAKSPINWVYYTPDRLEAADGQDRVIVLDFTAQWCLNCHALERTMLHQEKVVEALNAADVSAIKVDITKYAAAQKKLVDVGGRRIPLLIVYAPDGREVFR